VPYPAGHDSKTNLVEKILFERMTAQVRGPDDVINWKHLKATDKTSGKTPTVDSALRTIASVSERADHRAFAQYFPELTLLIIRADSGRLTKVYSLLHNREHINISWIMDEDGRLSPKDDTLTILPGILGSYPNQFITVAERDLPNLVEQISKIQTNREYEEFVKTFTISHQDPRIWTLYDDLNAELLRQQPIEAGLLDLSRY
jgi:hypothetical protein